MARALRRRALAAALGPILASACAPGRPPPVELVHLDDLERAVLAPTEPLRLTGEGLPPGREGTLSFHGEVRTPGGLPRDLAFEAPLAVDGAGAATAPVPPAAAPGARRSFAGRLEVRFRSVRGPDVVGRLGAAAFQVEGSEAPGARLRLDRAVAALGDRVGWRVAERDGALVLLDVEAPGRAARAGLAAGDVLVASGPFPLTAPEDLLGPDGDLAGGDLVVRRPGERGTRRVGLAAPVEARVGWPPGSLPLVLVGAWVGGLALSGRRRRPRPPAPPPPLPTRLLQGFAIALPPALAPQLPGQLPLAALWGLLVLGRALAAPGLAPTPSRLVVAVLRATLATTPAAGVLLLISVLTGEGTLGGLVASRPGALAVACPPLLLCLPALAHAVDRPGPGAVAVSLRAFGAGIAAALLGGGWGLAPGAAGLAAYALAASVLLAGFERVGRRPGGVPTLVAWGGVAAAAPLARLWPGPEAAALALPVVTAVAGAAVIGALLGRVRASGPPPLQPFV